MAAVSAEEHRARAPAAPPKLTVVTVSDSRTPATDSGGDLAAALIAAAGFTLAGRELVPDDEDLIGSRVRALLAAGTADVVLLTGGTGISPRDRTVEAVAPLLDRRLDGYGELFRMLSFAEIGAAAMLSRAVAGVAGRTVVFTMPGSPAGVRLALERLILPELRHLLGQLRRPAHGRQGPPRHDHDHAHGLRHDHEGAGDAEDDDGHRR
jgi:molybdenum cofactor biosynthesis protein B